MKIISIALMIFLIPVVSKSQKRQLTDEDNKVFTTMTAEIEKFPDSLPLHQALLSKYYAKDSVIVERQYKKWVKQFPKSFGIPYSIGRYLCNDEDPKAKNYLLLATSIKADLAEGWSALASDATRWGDKALESSYHKKAMIADPKNPLYAYRYANSLTNISKVTRDSLLLDIDLRYSGTDIGCIALGQLASYGETIDIKKSYYEHLYKRYINTQHPSFRTGMAGYFITLLNNRDYKEAFDLSLRMISVAQRNKLEWKYKLKVAKQFLTYQNAIQNMEPSKALDILKGIPLSDDMSASSLRSVSEHLLLEIADTYERLDNTKLAYDTVIRVYAVKPTLKLRQAMYTYGIKQKKDSSTVDKDVYAIRLANAQSATQFSLTNYLDGTKVNLKDYKGKLVLLTYWFPGCGPCRGEFPYFEATLKEFDKSKISYFGINILKSQDAYVVPFMNATNYSFIPLKDDISWDKGNLKVEGAPTNYLIDEEGRIIYSGFQINEFNPDGLELMIADLLKINALNKRLDPK